MPSTQFFLSALPLWQSQSTRRVRSLLASSLAACLALAASCGAPLARVELVECFPVETSLDQADLREAQAVWLEAIAGARQSIHLAHFYFSDAPKSRLRPVIDALLEAGRRGVEVQVLADAGFAKTYPETLAEFEAAPGFEVRRYDLRARTGGVLHMKLLSVDGERVFMGSQNFDFRSLEHIWELGVYVQSRPLALECERVFELDWYLAGHPEVSAEEAIKRMESGPHRIEAVEVVGARRSFGRARARFDFSPQGLLPPGQAWDLPDLIGSINQAKQSLRLAALSYQPDAKGEGPPWVLPQAVAEAAARGVRVQILVADWNKRAGRVEALQALAQVPNIEVRFAVIPDWSGGFLPFSRVAHSKLMVVDETLAWIGTGNLSPDYFHESRNASLFLEGAGPGKRLAAQFDALWNSPYSEPVDPSARYTPRRTSE